MAVQNAHLHRVFSRMYLSLHYHGVIAYYAELHTSYRVKYITHDEYDRT